MKTCISLYSYWKAVKAGTLDHYQAIDKTKELGVDAVELQIFDESVPEGMTMKEYAVSLTAHAREIGLDVPIFTVSSNLYCADPEAETERLCGMVDIAAECGIPMMRHDVTYAFLGNEPSKSPKKIIETVAPYIRRLADYARNKGIKTCSENHGRLIQDSYRMEELFYQVDHENYGLLCDIGNFGGADEDCAEAVSKLLPHICFVHAKDAFKRNGMMYDPGRGYSRTRGGHYRRATVFGHGDVPTFQILAAIKRSGYDGYVSLEFEGMEDPLLAIEIGIENLKRMIADLER